MITDGPSPPTRVGSRRVGKFTAEADGDGGIVVGSAGFDSKFKIPILGVAGLSRRERVVLPEADAILALYVKGLRVRETNNRNKGALKKQKTHSQM